jgi:23S rRNA-/tRNA-specific pseudouridylate synthase
VRPAKLFRERKAKKRYLAVVMGWPEEDEWTTNAKLGKDPECEKGFRERVDEEKGKASETHFKVLQRGYCSLEGENYGLKITRVECRPVTGRRHQIRVHLRHSGYPILGDQAYSPDRDSFRMYLHALELRMPFDEEELVFFHRGSAVVRRRRLCRTSRVNETNNVFVLYHITVFIA